MHTKLVAWQPGQSQFHPKAAHAERIKTTLGPVLWTTATRLSFSRGIPAALLGEYLAG